MGADDAPAPLPLPAAVRDRLQVVRADNPGAFTLDGTRTYIVGQRRMAVVDPGPDVDSHVRAVVRRLAGAEEVTVLLTHGHGDHAAGTRSLVRRLEGDGEPAPRRVRVAGPGHPDSEPLAPGDVVSTDAGTLVAVPTPGHVPDHVAFHWPEGRALFPGDLVLGRGDTTWVAGYAGCVADYLDSLERVRALDVDVLLPTHGDPLLDVDEALDRFESHRRHRIAQVEELLDRHPDADAEELVDRIYGDMIPRAMREPALESVRALLDHVRPGRGELPQP